MSARTLKRWLCAAVLLLAALVPGIAAAAAPAGGNAVANATYTGVATDGATVKFTISRDGTLVASYQVTSVGGSTCTFYAEGDEAVWSGAPIVDGSFKYQLDDAILLRGSFSGARTASGTIALHDRASGSQPACSTGTVKWTATTTRAARRAAHPNKHDYATRVTLHQKSATQITGRVTSAGRKCTAGRTIILWHGLRRISTTSSLAHGSFSFRVPASWHGTTVRTSVTARTVRAGLCTAGSSIFIYV